jgi:hypothetical protein
MRKSTLGLSVLAATLGLFALAEPAQAQATRTWVSGVGDDANPCSRTAPCKTFAGAISKTAANGIINCLDPGGFGAVTITKNITLDCKATHGGVLASGTNAININAANIVVNLRGLAIEGVVTGLVGVNFLQGAVLNIRDSFIFSFGTGTAQAVRVVPSAGNVKVTITDTAIVNSGTGINIAPTGTATARAILDRVLVANNGTGIIASGANALVLLHQSTVTGNTTGCSTVSSGVITSFRSNNLSGNVTTQCTPTNSFDPQ